MDFASLSPMSSASGATSVYTQAGELTDIRIFHDQASLLEDVKTLVPSYHHRMIAVLPTRSQLYLSAVMNEFPTATTALFLVSDETAEANVLIHLAVMVLHSSFGVSEACTLGATRPEFTVQGFCEPVATESSSINFIQIDSEFCLSEGKTGSCGVVPLREAKRVLPQEEECRKRVLLVKRANSLGMQCSSKLKAYFDELLNKPNAVEHVLMLPLKARGSGTDARPKPSKTGFIVFQDAQDAMLVRAMGTNQVVRRDAVIKVETYDGL